MDKTFQLQGKTAEGRPLIHLVEPGSTYGLNESSGLDKTASGEHLPEVMELIESIEPQPGRLYLVNSALGAGEYVGFNLRGDWFTEQGLTHTPPGWEDIPVWDVEARRRSAAQTEVHPRWGPMTWGYPTFYNAHRFRHHVNKDPNKAYGFILGAFWDPRMHRVILVSELIEDYCRQLGASDIYHRIQQGHFPDTSMGAKVPYDRCSICNHVAKSPKYYCEHVRRGAMPPYGMRKILPDGRMCGVYNDYPRFFDDSFVFIGAERSAKVMDNVTQQVRGNRAYTTRVFAPGRATKVAAAPGPGPVPGSGHAPRTEREEQEEELGRALAETAQSPVSGPHSKRIGEQISKVLSIIPVASAPEKKALDYVVDEARRQARVKDGNVTDAELRLWKDRRLHQLQHEGVGQELVDRARSLVQHHMNHVFGEKIGSTAKWAAHLKQIPAPSQHQMALIRDHEGRLVKVLPIETLDRVAQNPARELSALGRLGVVLKPAEFQFSMVKRLAPDGQLAGALMSSRVLFRPVPVPDSLRPRFRILSGIDPTQMQQTRAALGPSLLRRSFAPQAVQHRIKYASSLERHPTESFDSKDDPLLNKIAQLYNDYRVGLLVSRPDWSDVDLGVNIGEFSFDKTGEASSRLSNYLLHLAYWPSYAIG